MVMLSTVPSPPPSLQTMRPGMLYRLHYQNPHYSTPSGPDYTINLYVLTSSPPACGDPRVLWCAGMGHCLGNVQSVPQKKERQKKSHAASSQCKLLWGNCLCSFRAWRHRRCPPHTAPTNVLGLMNINALSPCFELSPTLITQTAIKHMHIVVLIKEIKSCVVGYFNKVV